MKEGVRTTVADHDNASTMPGEYEIAPGFAEYLVEKLGPYHAFFVATGRFPGQHKKLTGNAREAIFDANVANPTNIHVYGGGAIISDADNNIVEHSERLLHPDQIEGICDLVGALQGDGADPLVVFQSAEYGIFRPTGWTNGELTALFSNPSQKTPERLLMYDHWIPMPHNRQTIFNSIIEGNPAKVIIVAHSSEGGILSMNQIVERMRSYNLEVTGDHSKGIDICKQDTNKATALKIIADLLDIDTFNVYIGDSVGPHGNDRPPFSAEYLIKQGIVVTNGSEPDMSFTNMPYRTVKNAIQLPQALTEIYEA